MSNRLSSAVFLLCQCMTAAAGQAACPPSRYHLSDVVITLSKTNFAHGDPYVETVVVGEEGRRGFRRAEREGRENESHFDVDSAVFRSFVERLYDFQFFDMRPDMRNRRKVRIDSSGFVRETLSVELDTTTTTLNVKIGTCEHEVTFKLHGAPSEPLLEFVKKFEEAARP